MITCDSRALYYQCSKAMWCCIDIDPWFESHLLSMWQSCVVLHWYWFTWQRCYYTIKVHNGCYVDATKGMAYTIKVHNCSHTTWSVLRDSWVENHSHMCVAGIRREEHGKGKRELFCTCANSDITDQYKREVGLRAGSVILTIPPPTGSGWVNICVSFASSRFVPIDEVFEIVDL